MNETRSLSDVTVISVSYNSSPALRRMLGSLPPEVRVIIVDNAGSDQAELHELAARPNTRILTLTRNLGFGQGCNAGAREAETEFLFFLNPDTEVAPGAIEALLNAAGRYGPDTGFTPRIANNDGSPNFKRRSVLLPRNEWLPRGWPAQETEVPVISGAAMFMRRALSERFPFDPSIFMYHEDDDWSLRVRQAGGKLVFVPNAQVTHLSGHSSGRDPAITRFKAFHLGKSKVYALRKHRRPTPYLRSLAQAIGQLMLPHNLFSARKRAKHIGFLEGVSGSKVGPAHDR